MTDTAHTAIFYFLKINSQRGIFLQKKKILQLLSVWKKIKYYAGSTLG